MTRRALTLLTLCGVAGCLAGIQSVTAQEKMVRPFNARNLDGWLPKGPIMRSKWMVGKARLDPQDPARVKVDYNTTEAELVNSDNGSLDLCSDAKWGDAVIELEVMVPKGSNSGIYVMGEYEVQVFDSYGKEKVGPGDMGGLYGAAAPRVNACKAPGEWQTYLIDYTAPRYEGERKVANMRFNKVVLNGQVIHEDVEMKGPTPGGMTGKEAAVGPLMFQGDHGPVGYRNIRITPKKI